MEIVLWIYGCSWAILLIVLLFSVIFQKQRFKDSFDGSPWIYVLLVLLAPIVIFLIPYIVISSNIENRKRKKRNAEWELKQKKEEEERNQAKFRYTKAVSHSSNLYIPQFSNFAYTIFENIDKRFYANVVNLFNIKTDKNNNWGIELCKREGHGDKSKLFINLLNGERDYDIFKHIIIDFSANAAWKVYLLYSLWHILPLWWHANYGRRTYILQKSDLMSLSDIREQSLDFLSEINVSLEPTIHKYQDSFYVTCCYWTDWGGLIREYIEITVKDNKVVNIITFDTDVIYEYECGIRF